MGQKLTSRESTADVCFAPKNGRNRASTVWSAWCQELTFLDVLLAQRGPSAIGNLLVLCVELDEPYLVGGCPEMAVRVIRAARL